MAKVYSAADIQVVPSMFDDPCPLTVIEGMVMGLPQIVSISGGIPEEVSDENAIKESRNKYEAYCYRIAMNILSVAEDVEECINDTWISVWNRIPPVIPKSLKAFLGKLVRDISLSRYRAVHAQKRYNGMKLILDELAECINMQISLMHEDIFNSMHRI